MDDERFRDPLIRSLRELVDDGIHVVCPRCPRRAVVVPRPGGDGRRMSCSRCGYVADWDDPRAGSVWGGAVDPYFRLPLWLRAECCGGRTLWAFNERHLDLLDDYVAAKLRERGDGPGGMTLIAKLPAWLKSAKHRDEIRRAITRLRASLRD